jgi:hypothetical protein
MMQIRGHGNTQVAMAAKPVVMETNIVNQTTPTKGQTNRYIHFKMMMIMKDKIP